MAGAGINFGKEATGAFLSAFNQKRDSIRQDKMDALNIQRTTQQMDMENKLFPLKMQNERNRARKAGLELTEFENELTWEKDWLDSEAGGASGGNGISELKNMHAPSNPQEKLQDMDGDREDLDTRNTGEFEKYNVIDGDAGVLPEKGWIGDLPNTKRGNGGVQLTSYGQPNDSTPDSNTRSKRGFANNLLREGSVALSPQIYKKHDPEIGASVYLGGKFVGYYEDRSPAGYKGQSYGEVVDVYDPDNKVGPILKTLGNAEITFGPPRKQIRNA